MKSIFISIAILCVACPAWAQDSALSGKVRAALADKARGTCSAERLSPALRAACDSQPQLTTHLNQLGAIESLVDYGVQPTQTGAKPNVFRVVFSRGTMTWYAEEGPDGKLAVLWSDGQTAQR